MAKLTIKIDNISPQELEAIKNKLLQVLADAKVDDIQTITETNSDWADHPSNNKN